MVKNNIPNNRYLNITKLGTKKFENESIYNLKVARTNNQAFHTNDLNKVLNSVQKKYSDNGKKEIEVLLRGSNALNNTFTFKSFNSDLNIEDYDEYFSNRVANPNKFKLIDNLYFTIKVQND